MQPRDGGDDRGFAGRVLGRMVGTFVNPVVDTMDVESVVERIDVDDLVARVDVNELIERVDVNAVLDRVDVDAVLDRVDPDRLLDRVDPNRLLDRVDPNRLLDRVDPDRLLDRVDANRLLDRVDPDRLLDRVDPDRLMARVDADALLERVDVNRLIERTELGAIIARSTSGAFSQVLDVARSRIVMADQLVHVLVGSLLRRPMRGRPARPEDPTDPVDLTGLDIRARAIAVQGHHAGAVSRFLAFLLDQTVIGVLFGLIVALVATASEIVLGRDVTVIDHRWIVMGGSLLWWFTYTAGQLAVSGRTVGKAVLGLSVVAADGGDLRGRAAALRTAAFPFSFVLFGAGFLVGLVRGDRRQLHDLVARSAVIYAWDARTAALRALPAA